MKKKIFIVLMALALLVTFNVAAAGVPDVPDIIQAETGVVVDGFAVITAIPDALTTGLFAVSTAAFDPYETDSGSGSFANTQEALSLRGA